MAPPGKDGATTGGVGMKLPAAGDQGGLPPTIFYRFYIKNTLILTHFFTEKGHAVSAVTMDNAKIFLQLMSTSRNLAKTSESK